MAALTSMPEIHVTTSGIVLLLPQNMGLDTLFVQLSTIWRLFIGKNAITL